MGSVFEPHEHIKKLSHVVHIPKQGKLLRCTKCKYMIRVDWFVRLPKNDALCVLRPTNGHSACNKAPFVVVDGTRSFSDKFAHLDFCKHGRRRLECLECKSSAVEAADSFTQPVWKKARQILD